MTGSELEPLRLQTSRSFQFLYLLPILLAVALLVDLVLNSRNSNWPLIIGALLLALVTAPRALAHVALEEERLSLTMPLRAPKQIDLRQLVGFERYGRIGRALILRYHPLDEQGRLDIASEQFQGLPPLEQQFDLEARLESAISRQHPNH